MRAERLIIIFLFLLLSSLTLASIAESQGETAFGWSEEDIKEWQCAAFGICHPEPHPPVGAGITVEFARLETGKSVYAPDDTVKVIYEMTNPGTAEADYHVEYEILDPSGGQVYRFIGADHTIAAGATDARQSTKWSIPADAAQGAYEVRARCISEGGTDEKSTFFEVVPQEIEVSYILGYDMPMSESEPVPLRVRFSVKDESLFIIGIVGISISKQQPEVFFRYPTRSPSDPLNRGEYNYPGTRDAQYDFYIVKLIEQKQTVTFVALLDVVIVGGKREKIEVPFTVNIDAPFTVYANKMGFDTVGHPTAPLLDGTPLPLLKWTKGVFRGKLTLPEGSSVVIRELSGASYALQHGGKSHETYWDLTLGPWNLRELREYQMEEASATRMAVEKIGKDESLDKTLEVLFKRAGKKAAGPVGIILDIFEGSPANPSTRAVFRFRSTVGVTIAASGDVTVRNFEGSPEIIQPDGSVLQLPVGYESAMDQDGAFATPVPYDPENPSVRIWEGEIGAPQKLVHDDAVDSVTFSPDGSKVATTSQDNTAWIWDVASGVELQKLVHHSDSLFFSLAFSPDGSKLATINNSEYARIWDVSSGAELQSLVHDDSVWAVAFSPDGRKLATGCEDGRAVIWDVASGRELRKLVHDNAIFSVAFSPDGSKLATGSFDKTARIWDVSTGAELQRLAHDADVKKAVFSPDGSKVATASWDSTARIWDVASGTELQRLVHDYLLVFSVTFSPDGSKLATFGDEYYALIWDVASGAELQRLVHDGNVAAVAFSPDGHKLATASSDNTSRIWDVASGAELQKLVHDNSANDVAFSSEGSKVATASSDRTARIWNVL